MNKKMRRYFPLVLLLCLILAASSVQAASWIRIRNTTYNGYGNVEVTFIEKAEYKNLKVTVKDQNKKNYSTSILSKK